VAEAAGGAGGNGGAGSNGNMLRGEGGEKDPTAYSSLTNLKYWKLS
jgi:hypothetical protein